jgi:4-hydroxy-4-methyl-2-oxoglutarate aldolase
MSLCDGGLSAQASLLRQRHWRPGERALYPRQSKEQYEAKMDDNALFASLRDKLFTAVVGDVLDEMGWRRQFLPQAIGPLRPDMKIVGRAMPVLEADVFDEGSGSPGPLGGKPFGLMLEALDDLRPNEVYVATGGSCRYALWGELMSTRARYLRAAGAVLNGFVRDAAGIEALGFPTFCRGVYAQDQGPRGKVIDFRTPVEIEGVRIAPGDLIFGDREGVLIVPAEVESEAVAAALAKASTENKVATAIRGGMSAREAFETFGVL